MKKKNTVGNIELIEWEDHYSGDGSWLPITQAPSPTPMLCTTIGRIVAENKERVTVVGTWSDNGNAHSPMTIIKRCITERKVLKA